MIKPINPNDELYLYEKRAFLFVLLACYIYCGIKSRFSYNR